MCEECNCVKKKITIFVCKVCDINVPCRLVISQEENKLPIYCPYATNADAFWEKYVDNSIENKIINALQ